MERKRRLRLGMAALTLVLGVSLLRAGTLEDEVMQLRLPFAESLGQEASAVRSARPGRKAPTEAALRSRAEPLTVDVPAPPKEAHPRRAFALGAAGLAMDVVGAALAVGAVIGMSSGAFIAAGALIAVGSLLIEGVRFHREHDPLGRLGRWVKKIARRR